MQQIGVKINIWGKPQKSFYLYVILEVDKKFNVFVDVRIKYSQNKDKRNVSPLTSSNGKA